MSNAPPSSLLSSVQSIRLSYANGIWLADLDADAWKLKVHHGFLQPLGTVGCLALFTPPRDDAGREKWQRHQNYAGHILSEERQKQPNDVYRWVPEGSRPGHLRSQKANHYLDATAYAIAGAHDLGPLDHPPQTRPAAQTRQKTAPPRPRHPIPNLMDSTPLKKGDWLRSGRSVPVPFCKPFPSLPIRQLQQPR